MTNRILYMITFLALITTTMLKAQNPSPKTWGPEKIKGARLIPYPSYSGNPFLNNKFANGEIEFVDGTIQADISLRYSSYRDEIAYYNTNIAAQIVIDKISLKGFSFTDENGVKRIFRQQYYNGFIPGNRYFEVLSDGDIALLVFRKVVFQTCPLYYDEEGRVKNMSYQQAYNYYLYNKEKGYELIRISKTSIFSKFDKNTQKTVKKLFRKNRVIITDEASFVKAFNVLKENGIKISI